MKRAVFATTPFLEEIEFVGVDGEVYVLKPAEIVVIPYANAMVLERAKVGRIVGQVNQNDGGYDKLDEWDFVRTWAEQELQHELQKPEPDPDRVIELKMLINNINPEKVKASFKEANINNKAFIKTKPIPPTSQPHSHPTSPTGLS